MKFQAIDPPDMLKRKQQEDSVFRPSSQLTYCHEPGMFESHQNLLETMTQRSSENELDNMIREEEFESKSGTDIMEQQSDDQDPNQPRTKKKRYHRHTPLQIQEMESFYKECHHPDDKQRKALGRKLGLDPLQVKFWFQNKRTQMKAQTERHENSNLRTDNEKLRIENLRYKEALANATCPNCGGPASIGEMSFDEHQLRMDNIHLKEQIDRMSGVAAKCVGTPMFTYNPNLSPMTSHALDLGVGGYGTPPGFAGDIYSAGGLLGSVSGPIHEADKAMIIELAVAALEELIRMAHVGQPLWTPNIDNSSVILSEDEYIRAFPRGLGPKPLGLRSEASRESAEVLMNPENLVQILMDVNQWTCMFPSIVSRAMTLHVLSTGVGGNCDGALQVMTAEFQIPTHLVPTRENYFLRYCKYSPDGIWAVVDVSLDNLRPNNMSRCRRRPSGCVIQDLHDGRSKVIWVEHVEVDDRAVDNMYRGLVTSGLAFGAKRWVNMLNRQCQRLPMSTNDISMGGPGAGRKSMLKLAERMVMSFFAGVGASTAQTWTTVSGSGMDDVRVMIRNSMDDPGVPHGTVLSAATSFWIPVLPQRVFDFLRDENSRSQWDILSNGNEVCQIQHIANGYNQGNGVSLLRVDSKNTTQSNMLILQESSTDPTGSYIIYAPVDIPAMEAVITGGNPDYVALLPSGFAILPDGSGEGGTLEPDEGVVSGGSLITVAFQILVDSHPPAKLSLESVATVNRLITNTIQSIKGALACDNASLLRGDLCMEGDN